MPLPYPLQSPFTQVEPHSIIPLPFFSFIAYIWNLKIHCLFCACAQLLSHSWLFVTPWTLAYQAPLSMGFSRQEYWSRLPFPPPGDSSQPRDWTCISYIGRWVLYHWTTWEASLFILVIVAVVQWLSSMPSFLVLYCLPEFAQSHVHWVSDAI